MKAVNRRDASPYRNPFAERTEYIQTEESNQRGCRPYPVTGEDADESEVRLQDPSC